MGLIRRGLAALFALAALTTMPAVAEGHGGRDNVLLRAADALQRETNWHTCVPPL